MATARPKLGRMGIWASVRSKTLGKKTRKSAVAGAGGNGAGGVHGPDGEDTFPSLSLAETEILLSRIRVVLAHIEGNVDPNDILFLSGGGISPNAKEAAMTLIEALANDDTIYLVKTLQRYSCSTLGSVVKMALMCSPEPLVPNKVAQLLLNSFQKYAEYLDERDDEKVEEMGATLERFSQQKNFDTLKGLCQSLNRLPMPNDELAYIFAPLVLLPKISMLSDDSLPEEELAANFELLAAADGVIEAMEFIISRADQLFDSRSRKRALLKKGISREVPRIEPLESPVATDLHRSQALASPLLPHQDAAALSPTSGPTSCQVQPTQAEADDDSEGSYASASEFANDPDKRPICTATAMFDYNPVEDGEISLVRGESVKVLLIEDDGWWYGRNKDGAVGVFPGIYVQRDALPEPAQPMSGDDSVVPPTPLASLHERCLQYEVILQQVYDRLVPHSGRPHGAHRTEFVVDQIIPMLDSLCQSARGTGSPELYV